MSRILVLAASLVSIFSFLIADSLQSCQPHLEIVSDMDLAVIKGGGGSHYECKVGQGGVGCQPVNMQNVPAHGTVCQCESSSNGTPTGQILRNNDVCAGVAMAGTSNCVANQNVQKKCQSVTANCNPGGSAGQCTWQHTLKDNGNNYSACTMIPNP